MPLSIVKCELLLFFAFFFFFSSRRRHTRCSRDWSSDVCSSDLDVKRCGEAVVSPSPSVSFSSGFDFLPRPGPGSVTDSCPLFSPDQRTGLRKRARELLVRPVPPSKVRVRDVAIIPGRVRHHYQGRQQHRPRVEIEQGVRSTPLIIPHQVDNRGLFAADLQEPPVIRSPRRDLRVAYCQKEDQ